MRASSALVEVVKSACATSLEKVRFAAARTGPAESANDVPFAGSKARFGGADSVGASKGGGRKCVAKRASIALAIGS